MRCKLRKLLNPEDVLRNQRKKLETPFLSPSHNLYHGSVSIRHTKMNRILYRVPFERKYHEGMQSTKQHCSIAQSQKVIIRSEPRGPVQLLFPADRLL